MKSDEMNITKKISCIKYSNLLKKTHRQTFQYHITFKIMKNKYNSIQKILTNIKHLTYFHGKEIKKTSM
jgi:hypothetical protein